MTQQRTQAPGSFVTTSDGTEIFYKDWGSGQPLFFHHAPGDHRHSGSDGEDDRICPFPTTGARSVKLLLLLDRDKKTSREISQARAMAHLLGCP